MKKHKNILSDINCDVLILQSMEDEIIPLKTGELIYNNVLSNKKCLTLLKDCSHVVLSGNRKEEVSAYIKDYLKGGLRWKSIMKKEL